MTRFEREARHAKVEALVAEFDRQCLRSGIDPVRTALNLAASLSRWGAAEWAVLARAALVIPPSDDTIPFVIVEYVRRGAVVAVARELAS